MIIVKRIRVHLTRTPRQLSRAAALVAGLAVILAVTSLSPVSASAGTQAHSASASSTSAPGFGAQQAALYPIQRTLPLEMPGSCTAVRHELPRLAREGVRRVACTEPAPASSLSPRDRKALAVNLCVLFHLIRTRHDACAVTTITYTILSTQGEVLGTGLIGLRYSENLNSYSLNNSSWHWGLNVRIGMLSASGDVAVGTVAAVGVLCVNCTASPLLQEVPLPVGKVWSLNFHITAHGGAVTTTRQLPTVQIGNPNATEQAPPVVFPSMGPARCDHSPSILAVFGKQTYGCVFSDVAASYLVYLTRKKINNVAQNIFDGERTKPHHFGWFGHGSPLTRASNGTIQDKNRQAACGRTHYKKPWSCDEYPFADTYQGAHYFPHDYVTKKVLGRENSRESAYRNNMYRSERLLAGDAYWVFVLP
jgi:hypothetical protein